MTQPIDATVQAIGRVHVRVMDAKTGDVLQTFSNHNNVLNVGRRALLRGLTGLQTSQTLFKSCVIGDGGSYLSGSEYIERQVARERDGLFGSTLDELAVIGRVQEDANGMPYAIVSSVLGADSSANGSFINEIGLMLDVGTMYALMTWPGTQKTSGISIGFDWLVYFL